MTNRLDEISKNLAISSIYSLNIFQFKLNILNPFIREELDETKLSRPVL